MAAYCVQATVKPQSLHFPYTLRSSGSSGSWVNGCHHEPCLASLAVAVSLGTSFPPAMPAMLHFHDLHCTVAMTGSAAHTLP